MLTALRSISAFTANDPALFDTRDYWWEQKLMTNQAVCAVLPQRSAHPNDTRFAPEGEQELIARILKGDTAAERWFVQRFESLIRHILREMRLAPQDQDDLFQQVFLHLWEDRCRRLGQWHGEGRGGLVSYLRTIVKRQIFDSLRRRTTVTISLSQVEEEGNTPRFNFFHVPPGPEAAAITQEQKRAVQTAIYSLLQRDAQLIRRRYYLGQSYKEIAAAMEMTVNHVGTALARAEKRLRFKLEERYPGLFMEL